MSRDIIAIYFDQFLYVTEDLEDCMIGFLYLSIGVNLVNCIFLQLYFFLSHIFL